MSIFLVVFGAILVLIDPEYKFYTAMAFIIGALTSLGSGFIGMYVATRANVRVTYLAATVQNDPARPEVKLNLYQAFNAAFKGGCSMGFCLVSLALFVLTILIIVYNGKNLFNIYFIIFIIYFVTNIYT